MQAVRKNAILFLKLAHPEKSKCVEGVRRRASGNHRLSFRNVMTERLITVVGEAVQGFKKRLSQKIDYLPLRASIRSDLVLA